MALASLLPPHSEPLAEQAEWIAEWNTEWPEWLAVADLLVLKLVEWLAVA